MQRLTTILIMVLSSVSALAQDVAVEEEVEIRHYTVEVIIFSYAEEVSVGTEVFKPDKPAAGDYGAPEEQVMVFTDEVPAPEDTSTEPGDESRSPEFILHVEDEFTMNDIANRLERLDVYEPIMHFAWTQATYPEEETLPIDLSTLGEPPEGLSGNFKLYLSRYLHLVVDLTLDDPTAPDAPVAIEEPVLAFGDNRAGLGYDDLRSNRVRFRVQENRIFKSGDLRYFDHPKFGVLAKITRVEEDDADEVEPEMLGDDPRELVGGVRQ